MGINVGIIGLGYWGPNYIRNFLKHEQTEPVWGCDISEDLLSKIHKLHPQIKLTKDYRDLIQDESIDLIAVATPPETHYKIVKAALEANKHIFVAKPMAITSADSVELLKIAKEKKLLLHGDLTYLYSSSIIKIKDLLKNNIVGKPLYYDSIRTNLGLIQNNVNVIWDLAPHDFSIISFLFKLKPLKVFTVASKHYENSTGEEIAHITINYSNNLIAHIHLSWLSPIKQRTILIGGTEKMIYFNDIEPDEKVKIFDKGISIPIKSITPFKPVYRSGDIFIPKLNHEEALYQEITEIVNKIESNNIDYLNANLNIEITKLLEACNESLKTGREINLNL